MGERHTPPDPEFHSLLDYLKSTRGFDFTDYKPASLGRRIHKRMAEVTVQNYTDYIDYLEVHPDEFAQLFNTILINVTTFFRDKHAWTFLADEVIPQITKRGDNNLPIRVWSAGCASGEEAYSAAILLAEALGMDAYRERVKIFASDVDEDALQQARQASYGPRQIAGVSADLLEKYFTHNGTLYVLTKDLRRSVIFGRLDLMQDAPISRIDLLICRNVLMYFNSEAQSRILSRFHFALNRTGFLFLGKAEMLFTQSNLLHPVQPKQRVFMKIPQVSARDRLLQMNLPDAPAGAEANSRYLLRARFRESAFESSALPQLLVDVQGNVSMVNERARSLLRLSTGDLARPLQDLEVSYQIPALRGAVRTVLDNWETIVLSDIDWPHLPGDLRTFEITVTALADPTEGWIGANIIFNDVTRYKRLQQNIEQASQELETAYEELQSSNEELETTNEELQSAVEELETTNEELQSTNEELETMNEELQSTNEELEAINDELRDRTDEVNYINNFLDAILRSMHGAVVVVDKDLSVKVWSARAEDLWGLRPYETLGRNFLNLDIGLPLDGLGNTLRTCLAATDPEVSFEKISDATDRRGKAIRCKITCTPLFEEEPVRVTGVTLIMERTDGVA